MNQIRNLITTFHSTHENGSILCRCESSEHANGITVIASVSSGDRAISSMSHYVPFDEVSNLDIVKRDVVKNALLLAGIFEDTCEDAAKDTVTSSKKAKGRKKAGAADPVEATEPEVSVEVDSGPEEPAANAEETESADPIIEPSEKVPEDEPVEESIPDEPIPEEPESKVMTVEEAREVLLLAKTDAKTTKKIEDSALKQFVGKPIGLFADAMPSMMPVLAARAGKDSSMLTAETEEAIKIIVNAN